MQLDEDVFARRLARRHGANEIGPQPTHGVLVAASHEVKPEQAQAHIDVGVAERRIGCEPAKLAVGSARKAWLFPACERDQETLGITHVHSHRPTQR